MQVGENNAAILDFDFVLGRKPHDRLALFNRATLSEATGNYRAAIRDYTTVLRQYPHFITGYQHRARCYRLIGDQRHALQDERRVYIAQLDNMFGTHKRPAAHATRKQQDEDIDNYQKIVVSNDEKDIAKFYTSDYRGRIQDKQVAVQLQPPFFISTHSAPSGLVQLTPYADFVNQYNEKHHIPHTIYLTTRDTPLAAADIEDIHKESAHLSDKSSDLLSRAIYCALEHDYQSSLKFLDNKLSKSPQDIFSLFLRSTVRARQAFSHQTTAVAENSVIPSHNTGKAMPFTLAIRDLDYAISLSNHTACLYYNRACLRAAINELTSAIDDFTQAIKLNPELAEAYYNRGILYANQGNYTQGFQDLGKAGELGLYTAYSLIKHYRQEAAEAKQQKH